MMMMMNDINIGSTEAVREGTGTVTTQSTSLALADTPHCPGIINMGVIKLRHLAIIFVQILALSFFARHLNFPCLTMRLHK